MKDQTHEDARRIVELYLSAKGRNIMSRNLFKYPSDFIKDEKLDNRYPGHSYDIMTDNELVEIDDYQKHSKKNQKINDGIATKYAKKYLPEWGFYRLQKEEIVDRQGRLLDPKDVAEYLRQNLF